ncbi:acetyltransferase [Vibrio metschnikovii]|uniref:acetyltransferase n=1 Tax=Vibrio metschnikovii TaxID=28172 RepID=UPI002FCA4731
MINFVRKRFDCPIERPKIKASKKLDLSGDAGRQIVKSETKLALRTHQKTFTKLADM